VANHLLTEPGFRFDLEDGTGTLLLEQQPSPTPGDYLVQEPDGTSRFTLEDGSGFILLEAAAPPQPPFQVVTGGTVREIRRRLAGFPGDDEVALALLVSTRKRFRLK
jgi:hypothetical protein